ncbi:MAG: phosphate ABC transporter permease PstA [Propionibacteriaceae bacterium]|nr:phosphate ABC transporter permease PstA [Propionibacteriaceae bacterium]
MGMIDFQEKSDLVSMPKVKTSRKVTDRVVKVVIIAFFGLALLPLISLLTTVITRGVGRFDPTFFSSSMRGVVGAGGGAVHAIWGTLLITGTALIISAPIGIAAAVYLVEYGRGKLAKLLTFLVDVMTGIPSIVAGLFAYAVFSIILGPGTRSGVAGSIALSLLMIPVVIRSSEEMLRLVPGEQREAAIALGSPKYRSIWRVILPAAAPGIVSGVMLGICRIIGETAPLLLVAGFTDSMNLNVFDGRMATLPVFIYSQWQNKGTDSVAYEGRAWSAALMLIGIVLIMNIAAKLIAARTQKVR